MNIQETIGYGGVERTRLSLAKLLDKDKYELKIICTRAVGSIADDIRANNVEVIEIGIFNSLFNLSQHKKVMKIIDEFKPHIIHGAVFEGVTMAAINGFLKRVPIVVLEETSDPKNRSWKANLLMKLFVKTSDKVIGVSPGVVDYLKNELNIKNEKIALIDNGVVIPDILSEKYKKELKNKFCIQDDEIVIGSVGRMLHNEHKRFSDLIKAFSKLIKKGLKVRLILVGEGVEKANYQKLVKDLNIDDKVIFTGYQSEVNKFYGIFDIFSLVSAYEAFGLVLAEAMLHKLPVVATRVGGMQYIVDDNDTGFLIEKYDVNSIADKLEVLCLNEELRLNFGQNGYKKAINNYTEQIYVENVDKLYDSLVVKKKINK
ncbi:glycosyltransferase family 4 protein [Flavobacterium sp. XS2P12]|uniref:glycosyltransferase family 4 protein n=1 Tax=Flavobacterium melibiosi TaxID=3398734 RepID=UPI003A868638